MRRTPIRGRAARPIEADPLKLARALRDRAGLSQDHAEAAADPLAPAVAERVATQQDIANLRAERKAELASGLRDVEQRGLRWISGRTSPSARSLERRFMPAGLS
jgi:hypothetical protein